jgi:hypothetical protein
MYGHTPSDRRRVRHHIDPAQQNLGFSPTPGQLPSPQAIDAARMDVGLDAVLLDQNSLTVRFTRTGVELNLGAIGKGFALDRAGADLRAAGMTHALLSAGRSSLLAVGGRDGGWWIDVISPNTDRRSLKYGFMTQPWEPAARVNSSLTLRVFATATSSIRAADGRPQESSVRR